MFPTIQLKIRTKNIIRIGKHDLFLFFYYLIVATPRPGFNLYNIKIWKYKTKVLSIYIFYSATLIYQNSPPSKAPKLPLQGNFSPYVIYFLARWIIIGVYTGGGVSNCLPGGLCLTKNHTRRKKGLTIVTFLSKKKCFADLKIR